MQMTSSEEKPAGLLESLKQSPATQRLMEEGKDYLRARGAGVASGIGHRMESATSKVGEVGAGGSLKPITEGVRRLAEGKSPARAIAGAAGGSFKDKIKEKVKGLFGKGRGGGGGNKKSMNIVESIDVGVPVSEAYNQWTQFQEFAKFMKGVENVEQASETESNWRVKVFKSRRSWKANITEQVPDRRIVWTSDGAKGSTQGVITFHPLADDLTRVLLSMRYYPQGLFEKTGNIWRAGGRRARLDLKNYRTFIMSEGEATGSWRGEIHDGQVTAQPEENEEQEGQEQEGQQEGQDRANGARAAHSQPEAEGDQEEAEAGTDETEGAEDEADVAEDEDEGAEAEDEGEGAEAEDEAEGATEEAEQPRSRPRQRQKAPR